MASRFDVVPQFNPYIQDANMEMLTQVGLYKQQQYYEGVAKAQSYIDNVAGINLIKDADKNYLNEKLQKLSADVSKVAGEDFSNPFLQTKIGSLAHGISSDEKIVNGILGTNKVLEKQKLIKDIRTNKPDLYNPANEAYSMMDISSWLNDGQAGTPLVDNKPYYNYYDYSKEVREAMKNFKPSKISNKIPKGEWMVTNTDASYTPDEVRRYLEGTLSDKAKQQLKIDGVVAFAGRDNDLLGAYYKKLKDSVKSNESQIDHYQAQKAGVPREQQSILDEKIRALKEESLDAIEQYSKIDRRDLNSFNANKENIAGYLYRDAYLGQTTRGYSHVDIEQSYDANDVWKAKFQQSMENARLNTRLAFDAQQNALDRAQQRDLKMIDLGYKMMTKDGKIKDVNTDNNLEKAKMSVSKGSMSESGRDQFESEVQSLNKDMSANYTLLRQKMLNQSPQLRDQFQRYLNSGGREHTDNDPATVAALKYITEQAKLPTSKRDVWANDFIEESNRINVRKSVLNQFKRDIDEEVARNYGKDVAKVKRDIENIKPASFPVIELQTAAGRGGTRTTGFTIKGNQTITADDVIDYLTDKLSPKKSQIIATALSLGGPGSSLQNVDPSIRNSAREYIDKIQKAIGNTTPYGGRGAVINKLRSAREFENKLYDQSTVNLGDWWTPVGDEDPRVKQAINYIANQAGGKPEEYSVARVNRTTGEIQFKLNPKSKTTNLDPKLIESLGLIEDKVNKTYTMKGVNYFQRDFSGITPTEQELVRALEGNTNIPKGSYYTPPHSYDPNGNGQFIQIVKDLDKAGNPRYWIRSENENMNIDYQNFQDPISAIRAARAFTADIPRMQAIINNKKNIPEQ